MEITEVKMQVRAIFDPLADRLGWRGPIEIMPTHAELLLGYFADDIGIQITIDFNAHFVFVLLFRPSGQTMPLGYMTEEGIRQKLYLQDALEELGVVCSTETKELQKLRGDIHNYSTMAVIMARLIEANWSRLADHGKRFFKERPKGSGLHI